MEKASKNRDFLNFRYLQEASSNNPKYDYLWMMKYYFMNDAYEEGLLTEDVVWMDFGFDHGGITYCDEKDYDSCGTMTLVERSTFPVYMIRIQ